MDNDNDEQSAQHPYYRLGPEDVLDAVEASGLRCDGRLLELNSYENRVYQVGVEDGTPVIAKFYRPGRWSDEAIREEHGFTRALADAEVPAVPPLRFGDLTLLHHKGFRFAVYPRRGGHAPDPGNLDQLTALGRYLGRLHVMGALAAYEHRPSVTIQSFGHEPARYVLEHGFVPAELSEAYRSLVDEVLGKVAQAFEQAGAVPPIRLHGDCHLSNILWTDAGPHFVDFDDSRMGPAVQDLWMLLSGDRDEMTVQLSHVLHGYTTFCEFNPRQLRLIEALRSLRLIQFAGWLARRWSDPAFPRAFPWFNTMRYWEDQLATLREQSAALDAPPLSWWAP